MEYPQSWFQEWPRYDKPTMPNATHPCQECGNPVGGFRMLCNDCLEMITALDLKAALDAAYEKDAADLAEERQQRRDHQSEVAYARYGI